MPVGSRPAFRERLTLAVVRPELRARDGTPVPGRGSPTPNGAAATLTTPRVAAARSTNPASKGGGDRGTGVTGVPGGVRTGRDGVRRADATCLGGAR